MLCASFICFSCLLNFIHQTLKSIQIVHVPPPRLYMKCVNSFAFRITLNRMLNTIESIEHFNSDRKSLLWWDFSGQSKWICFFSVVSNSIIILDIFFSIIFTGVVCVCVYGAWLTPNGIRKLHKSRNKHVIKQILCHPTEGDGEKENRWIPSNRTLQIQFERWPQYAISSGRICMPYTEMVT